MFRWKRPKSTCSTRGRRVWRGKCRSEPGAIAAAIRQHAPEAVRIGIETGPLTTWLWTELIADGLPMVCLDARHAKKALDMKVNKTDANGTPLAWRTSSARDGTARCGSRVVRPCGSRRWPGHAASSSACRPTFQPDPRHYEDLRPGRAQGSGRHVRDERSRPARRQGRHRRISCPCSMRGAPCAPAPPAQPPAHRLGSPEHRLPSVDDHADGSAP